MKKPHLVLLLPLLALLLAMAGCLSPRMSMAYSAPNLSAKAMVTTSIHMENVQDGIRKFYQRHGKLPETLAEVKGTLCTRMYDNTGWDKKTKDGWGRPFLYERTGDTTYRLRSLALESVLGTEKVKDIHVDADAATRTAAGSAAERSDAQRPD